jgi:hypothetical protein
MQYKFIEHGQKMKDQKEKELIEEAKLKKEQEEKEKA